MDRVVGTCSLCGGAVVMPAIWFATVPPIPTCRNCGATKKKPYGPTVEMAGGRKA